MSSLVLDSQRHIIESDRPVSDLLRMALVIAKKLELKEVEQWIESELNGYSHTTSVPRYRDVSGEPVALSFGKWEKIYVGNLDTEILQQISMFHIDYPVDEIESM